MCPDGTICDRNAVCQHAGGNRYRYANLIVNVKLLCHFSCFDF
jgi:hypothetical protein